MNMKVAFCEKLVRNAVGQLFTCEAKGWNMPKPSLQLLTISDSFHCNCGYSSRYRVAGYFLSCYG